MGSLIEQTSSIGAVWPPMPSSQERIRGFYTGGVITSQAESDGLAHHVYKAVEEMNQSEVITRVSFRVVAELGSLARLNFDNLTTIEAALPIAGTDLGVVYIGANASVRRMDSAHANSHLELLAEAATRSRSSLPQDVEMKVVDHHRAAELAESFAPLYGIFGYDHDATRDLLSNQANIIVYATADNQIVSTAMAERGIVTIQGYGNLSLVEITEASTHPDYVRRGLYTKVSGRLIEQIVAMRRQNPGSIDLVYGESNLAMPGVINAAYTNGRRFSYLDRDELHLENPTFGILPQNFKVEDTVETRPYNDFAVSYVPL